MKSFIDKAFKPIIISCAIIVILAIGIVSYIDTPKPPPYTIAKSQDITDHHLKKGILHIYTEATTEKQLFDTAKALANGYKKYKYELIYIWFSRDGDPVDYGSTVGGATVENNKVTWVSINTPEVEESERAILMEIEETAKEEAEKRAQAQPTNKQIAQFTGSASKQTKKFTINSDQFTIKSRLSPDNDYGVLVVYLYNSDGTLNTVVTSTTDKEPVESTYYGSGEYYLDIDVANGKYNVRIVEEN